MTRDEVYATLKQAIEYGRSTVPVRLAYDQLVAHDAEQRAMIEQQVQEIARLRAALNVWQSLFRQAVNVAGGLTNYVDDRPGLHHAERRITLLEQQAKQALKE